MGASLDRSVGASTAFSVGDGKYGVSLLLKERVKSGGVTVGRATIAALPKKAYAPPATTITTATTAVATDHLPGGGR